jgi:hypothetical protein
MNRRDLLAVLGAGGLVIAGGAVAATAAVTNRGKRPRLTPHAEREDYDVGSVTKRWQRLGKI